MEQLSCPEEGSCPVVTITTGIVLAFLATIQQYSHVAHVMQKNPQFKSLEVDFIYPVLVFIPPESTKPMCPSSHVLVTGVFSNV